jgi:hypothetical protein
MLVIANDRDKAIDSPRYSNKIRRRQEARWVVTSSRHQVCVSPDEDSTFFGSGPLFSQGRMLELLPVLTRVSATLQRKHPVEQGRSFESFPVLIVWT